MVRQNDLMNGWMVKVCPFKFEIGIKWADYWGHVLSNSLCLKLILCHFYHSFPERPQINAYQGNVTFMSSQNITLRCSADGYPRPEIRWMKDGQELPILPGARRGEIVHYIVNASRDSEGIYTCVASNTAGADLLLVYVTYHGKSKDHQDILLW